jgi:peptide chain release factor 1
MWQQLEEVELRFVALEEKMGRTETLADRETYQKLAKDYHDLKQIVEPFRRFKHLTEELESSRRDLRETDDPELKTLLLDEIARLTAETGQLESDLKRLLIPKDPNDAKDVILEIRAGAGGDEASLFAGELVRMYLRFADAKKWKTDLLSENSIGIGGYKEVIVEITGRDVYSYLRFESGVHRVQRVPVTESSGRIHTSTVTVAVLPEADEVEVDIKDGDLKIDTFRSSSAGGQHVNKTSSAIRITHIPTGIVVVCQDERSQFQNKDKAMRVLRAHLLHRAEDEQRREMDEKRRVQVGSGERSEKIRTYNFPQSRVTDHRIGLTTHDLHGFLEGSLEQIIEPLRTKFESERLLKLQSLSPSA